VKEGRYGNASEVVRAGLRMLKENEAQLAAFRQAVLDGVNSGPSTPFDFDAFMERKRAESEKSR
jgi:antitoxin ParD1/3/4